RQWHALAERLTGSFPVVAPDFYGSPSRPHWMGAGPFRLADEAAAVLPLIDAAPALVHLVGHSDGGALALHLAVARPHRIASLSLYEPATFHVLRAMGPRWPHASARRARGGAGHRVRSSQRRLRARRG